VNLRTDLAYRSADVDAAQHLVRRLDLLHADRCAQATAGDEAAAVRDARLIPDLIGTATVPQLQAALILATTPELRSIPVVLGPAEEMCQGLPLPVGDAVPSCGTRAAHFPHRLSDSIRYRTTGADL
jgi:hypothetical protein